MRSLPIALALLGVACQSASPTPQVPGASTSAPITDCQSLTSPELYCTLGRAEAPSESAARQIAEADAADQLVLGLVSQLTSRIESDQVVETRRNSTQDATKAGGDIRVETPLGNLRSPEAAVTGSHEQRSDAEEATASVRKHFTREASASLFGLRLGQAHWDVQRRTYAVVITVPYESLRAYVEGIADVQPQVQRRILRAIDAMQQAHASTARAP